MYNVSHSNIALALLCMSSPSWGEADKDNSKPTNVYSQVDNYFEYTTTDQGNGYGYHPKINYAPNESELYLIEVPILHNEHTGATGVRDLRFRYFNVPYRDYSKTFGALGLSFDAYIPVGNVEKGLGNGRWNLSPGVMFGIIANDDASLSFFPTLAYSYTSTSNAAAGNLPATHGMSVQVLSSYKINRESFIQVTPILELAEGGGRTRKLEVEYVRDVFGGDYQAGFMYRRNFDNDDTTYRLNFTVFL